VAPEHKLRLVKALQAENHVVAMTGDGVNDAPALKRADIGVAMGQGGTEVACEAADMVLLDDNFASIVAAVREGRRIHDNIRRFVKYAVTTNSAEIWVLFLAQCFALPVPLLPIHILWINLLTDGLPGIALTREPAERDIMRRPPRPPGRPLLSRAMVWWSLLQGALTLGIVAAAYAWLLYSGQGEAGARTGGFLSLVAANVMLILTNRTFGSSLWASVWRPNRALWRMLALTGLLLGLVLALPPMRTLFQMALPDAQVLSAVGVSALCTLLVLQGMKWFRLGKA